MLDTGGSAEVYKCLERISRQERVVKIIPRMDIPEQKEQDRLRIEVLNEVKLMEIGKGHPNVVQLVDFFE